MDGNVTDGVGFTCFSQRNGARCGAAHPFATFMILTCPCERRPSVFNDILNDSYDVTEEKTADRSAG